MFKVTLSLFLIGHFLGDFYLQSNKLADSKEKAFDKLMIHGLIYFFSMALVIITILGLSFLKWVVLVSLIHFLVDGVKFYLNKNNRIEGGKENFLYILDQLTHLVTILIVTVTTNLLSETIEYTNLFKSISDTLNINVEFMVTWILAIIIIIKPVSITIKKLLIQYQPMTVDEEERGHPGAGSLIGILERLIILIMISQNQYAAIGFVLTSKTIARYNKIIENPQFSEYYLLGTLLSMLLVIITYIIIVL